MVQRYFYARLLVLLLGSALSACGGGDGGNGGAPTGNSSASSQARLVGGSLQGVQLNLSGTVSTYAGLIPALDGRFNNAHFSDPTALAGNGNFVYIADTNDQVIRAINISTTDATTTGQVTTVAGSGSPGHSDGLGRAASFNYPHGLVVLGQTLYVADTQNNAIRAVDLSTGAVSTLAGDPSVIPAGNKDGTGSNALFNQPQGITTDGTYLYVADTHNDLIRRIDPATADVVTIAGSTHGFKDDATSGLNAQFAYPAGLVYANNALYIADSVNNRIRGIDLLNNNAVTTLAGSACVPSATTVCFADAPSGPGTSAIFNFPQDISVDSVTAPTTLYVTDSNNIRIRAINISSGAVTTYAGNGTLGYTDSTNLKSSFYSPVGIVYFGNKIYIADAPANTIREISVSTSTVNTIAGISTLDSHDGPRAGAQFFYPSSVTTDGSSLYIADTSSQSIRQISFANSLVTTVADSSSGVVYPRGITNDGTYIYVSNTGANNILRISKADSTIDTLISTGLSSPVGITSDGTYLYIVDSGNNAIKKYLKSTGALDRTLVSNGLNNPQGITYNGKYLYVADSNNNAIHEVDPDTGAMSDLVSSASNIFKDPSGITTDGDRVYVTDDYAVYQVAISGGKVDKLAGTTDTFGYTDGSGGSARFNTPKGITTDDRNLYITDSSNNTIRLVQ